MIEHNYLKLNEWQFYWKKYDWKLRISTYPADEYGPKEIFVFFGPLQLRFIAWRIDKH